MLGGSSDSSDDEVPWCGDISGQKKKNNTLNSLIIETTLNYVQKVHFFAIFEGQNEFLRPKIIIEHRFDN